MKDLNTENIIQYALILIVALLIYAVIARSIFKINELERLLKEILAELKSANNNTTTKEYSTDVIATNKQKELIEKYNRGEITFEEYESEFNK